MNDEILNENGGQVADTPTADSVDNSKTLENEKSAIEEFSETQQSRVNDIVRERLAKDRIARLKKYGFTTDEELDGIIEKGKKYDELKTLNESLQKDRESYYFLKARIKDEKIDDVKTYFKGKEMDFTLENLIEVAKTHPEWLKEEVKGNVVKTFGFNSAKKPVNAKNPEEEFSKKLQSQSDAFRTEK